MDMTKACSNRGLTVTLAGAAIALLGALVLDGSASVTAQTASNSGVIAGTVTADRGEVRAFRVKARDTLHRITYTVFTNKGRYQNLQPAARSYEVQVLEVGFDSRVQKVEVKAGDSTTVNLTVKANGVGAPRGEGGFGPGGTMAYAGTQPNQTTTESTSEPVELVNFDTLYPPAPARDVMMNTCFGCHGANGDSAAQRAWHRRRDNEAGWRRRVEPMFVGGKGGMYGQPIVTSDYMSNEQKESIISTWP